MTGAERALLDDIAGEVQPEDGKPVTRTEVAVAALREALIHPSEDFAQS
jgi:hypothetical protein